MFKWHKLYNLVIILVLLGTFVLVPHVVCAPSDTSDTETYQDFSIYPGLQLQTNTKTSEFYTLSVSHPYTEVTELNHHINEWIEYELGSFLTDVEASKGILEVSKNRAHLNISVDTNKLADDLYALEIRSAQSVGEENRLTRIKPLILDLKQKKILEITDVVKQEDEIIEPVKKAVIKDLHNNPKINDHINDDKIEEIMSQPENWNWAINSKSLLIYFDQYEVIDASAIKVEIPIYQFIKYLNKDVVERIDVEKEPEIFPMGVYPEREPLNPNGKYVALTFDDGPSPEVTPRILNILSEHNASATFFMLGGQVAYYPDLVKKVQEAGHEIGNHSMNHPDLSRLNDTDIKNEIQKTNDTIAKIVGYELRLFRPPYGAMNDNVKKITKELNSSIILWTVDSLDWKSLNAKKVNEEIMSHVHPNGIVLMHDIHPSTADALPQLLDSLEDQGYEMVTVSQILEQSKNKN